MLNALEKAQGDQPLPHKMPKRKLQALGEESKGRDSEGSHGGDQGPSAELASPSGTDEPGQSSGQQIQQCPYLSTIDRQAINFDFERVCSVTSRNQSIYCCLVCGKYFQGKGEGSPARIHCVTESHFVFINMHNAKIYCLPDDYQVNEPSLDDIVFNLQPKYSEKDILAIDKTSKPHTDVFGQLYTPGFSAMNDLSSSDFINVVVGLLAQVHPLRDYFLDVANYQVYASSRVVVEFGELVRKLWNPLKLKAAVSAHNLLQAVSTATRKKFHFGVQADAAEFLKYMLNELHTGLGGSRKRPSIVSECFQGKIELSMQELARPNHNKVASDEKEEGDVVMEAKPIGEAKRMEIPAFIFSLELPASQLFKDSRDAKSLVSVIDMQEILAKYSGELPFDTVDGEKLIRKTYRILELPPFVLFHVNRFTNTGWGIERNRTVVTLQVDKLDLGKYLKSPPSQEPTTKKLGERSSSKSRQMKGREPISLHKAQGATVYSLLSNICYKVTSNETESQKQANTGAVWNGTYLRHAYNAAQKTWFEIHNLEVKTTMPQLIACSESYLSVYQAAPAVQ